MNADLHETIRRLKEEAEIAAGIEAEIAPRRKRSMQTMIFYKGEHGLDTAETDIVDLVTDLKHLANERDVDWSDVQRMSEVHFRAELAGEP